MLIYVMISSPSHLFFERNNRSQRDAGRFSIALKDIMEVVRAKPFAVMPGSGMSIEVTLKTGEKVGVWQWEWLNNVGRAHNDLEVGQMRDSHPHL